MTRIDERTPLTHSPGPWTVEDGRIVSVPLSDPITTTAEGAGRGRNRGLVASIHVSGHLLGETDLRYTIDGNLALVAAAPELLALLKGFVRAWDELPGLVTLPYEAFIAEAEAVIAKAEGR